MWPLTFLMGDFINKAFFKGKFKMYGCNSAVIELLRFVRCNEVSLYRGSFSYILLYLRQGKSFLIPKTLLYRGSMNNIGAFSRCKPRIPASQLVLPVLHFDLLY